MIAQVDQRSRGIAALSFVRREPSPSLPPPVEMSGVIGWLRANLFSDATSTILTILTLLFLVWAIPPIIKFLIIDAVWSGSDRQACLVNEARPHVGACWPFVRDRFAYFIYGSYPISQRWRVDAFFALLA